MKLERNIKREKNLFATVLKSYEFNPLYEMLLHLMLCLLCWKQRDEEHVQRCRCSQGIADWF